MIIEIKRISDDLYEADCKGLPGSPPVGRHKDIQTVIKILLINLIFEKHIWFKYIDFSEYREVIL